MLFAMNYNPCVELLMTKLCMFFKCHTYVSGNATIINFETQTLTVSEGDGSFLLCVQISALLAGGLHCNVTVEYNFTVKVLGKFVQNKKAGFLYRL